MKIRLKTYPRRCRLKPAITVSPRLLLFELEILCQHCARALACRGTGLTYKRSDITLKLKETGICRKRPTDARALLVRAGNPKLLTIDGEYVSNARWGPLLQSVMRKWTQRRQFEN